jgi:uncharacterized membrane protein ArfB
MGFITQWLWYLLAFLIGSAVAWAISVLTVPLTSREEAIADLPGSRESGAR